MVQSDGNSNGASKTCFDGLMDWLFGSAQVILGVWGIATNPIDVM